MQQVVLFASSPRSLNLDEFFVEQKRMQGIKNLWFHMKLRSEYIKVADSFLWDTFLADIHTYTGRSRILRLHAPLREHCNEVAVCRISEYFWCKKAIMWEAYRFVTTHHMWTVWHLAKCDAFTTLVLKIWKVSSIRCCRMVNGFRRFERTYCLWQLFAEWHGVTSRKVWILS